MPVLMRRVRCFGAAAVLVAVVTAAPIAAAPADGVPPVGVFAPGGGQPTELGLGDLNRDGVADIVAANTGGSTITVLLSRGRHGFTPPVRYPVGSSPDNVVIRDLNADGRPDVLAANAGDATVSALLGTGRGRLAAALTSPAGGFNRTLFAIAVADFNRDQRLDVASTDPTGAVTVVYGDGTGRFSHPRSFPAPPYAVGIGVGDFNKDHRADLAVGGFGSDALQILLGDGRGGFRSGQQPVVGQSSSCVRVADVNGDGSADVISANFGSNDVGIVFGRGDGRFRAVERVPVGRAPSCFGVGRFVESRHRGLDLAVANVADLSVSVLDQGSGGRFRRTDLEAGQVWTNQVADVTGDRHLDVVAAGGTANAVLVFPGDGRGGFAAPIALALG